MSQTERPPERILELGNAFLASRALFAADELGLFETLRDGPLSRREIEAELDLTHHHGVRDFLDVLVAHDLLERTGDERYARTPLSATYLDPENDLYVGDYLTISRDRMYESASAFRRALRTGTPQNELDDGETLYHDGDLYADDESRAGFQDAMKSLSAHPVARITETVDWSQFDTVCDLGTAKGTMARAVAEASDCRVVGFDLPPAREGFESYTGGSPAADRLEFVAGDFFEDPLPEADAYVLGHILNDWDETEKRELVETVADALPADGAVLVHETMLDDDRSANRFGLYMNLVTMLELRGGYCATVGEYESLLSEAGFETVETRPIPGSETLLIGRT